MTEEELQTYTVEVGADEEWSEEVGDFVKWDEEDIERFVWYKIPAAIVNAKSRCRAISRDEAHQLLETISLDDLTSSPEVAK